MSHKHRGGPRQLHLKQHRRLTAALQYVVANLLRVSDVMAVRITRGVRRLAKHPGAMPSLLYTWIPGDFANVQIVSTDAARIDLLGMLGSDWMRSIQTQVFIHDGDGRSLGRALNDAPVEDSTLRPEADAAVAVSTTQRPGTIAEEDGESGHSGHLADDDDQESLLVFAHLFRDE